MTFAPGQNDSRVTGRRDPQRHEPRLDAPGPDGDGARICRAVVQRAAARAEIEPPDRPIGVFGGVRHAERGALRRRLRLPEREPDVGHDRGRRSQPLRPCSGGSRAGHRVPPGQRPACVRRTRRFGLRLDDAVRHARRGHTERDRDGVGVATFAEAPEPLAPIGIFACVTPRGDAFDVSFGYDNPNSVAVSVPIGIANAVLPRPIRHGQPDVFEPGRVERAFTVRGVRDTRLAVLDGRVLRALPRSPSPARSRSGAGLRLSAPRRNLPALRVDGQERLTSRSSATRTSTSGTSMSHADPRTALGPSAHGGRQPSSFRAGLAPIALVIRYVPVART